MAFQVRGAIAVKLTWKDETGSLGYSGAFLPAATLLADVKTKGDALAAAALALSDCALIGYAATARFANDANPVAAAGSRVERKAAFIFQTAAFKYSAISIPSPLAAIVKQSGGIDSQNAAVQTFVTAVTGGGWCDSNASDLTTLVADYERSNATSKRQATTDVVVDAA